MGTQVLFVDDQPQILQALRRMLRSKRDEWDMHFADSGVEALRIMDEVAVDAIVSDVRMPGIDGAQLLSQVQKRSPHTIRIVLSGQTDQENVFRLVGISHQFLSKPCNTDILVDAINRALVLRQRLANENVQTVISGLGDLPTPAPIFDDLVDELRSPRPSLQKVGAIVASDASLTLKVLQIVSSEYFGIGRELSTPHEAVRMLGLERIKGLVLSHGIASKCETMELGGVSFDHLWKHALACAGLAQAIAEAEDLGQKAIENAFVAGLLHDVGTLVLATAMPDEHQRVAAASAHENGRLETETREFGANHASIGAYLAGLWGLTDAVVEAIAYHHWPSECANGAVSVLTAVHVAEGLTQALDHANPGNFDIGLIDREYLASLGVADRLPVWGEIFINRVHELIQS